MESGGVDEGEGEMSWDWGSFIVGIVVGTFIGILIVAFFMGASEHQGPDYIGPD